ncbi:MAG: diguanylate cyclase [Spirochaetia bacterium]|nr:diguanylate cyclase [Spirochaetia bacterium]
MGKNVQEISARIAGGLEDAERQNGPFRTLSERATVGIARVEPMSGRFLWVNEKLCAITGYTAAELRERRFQDITHPDHNEADRANMKKLTSKEILEFSTDKRYIRKDGRVIWVHINVFVLEPEGEWAEHYCAIIQDITERRRLEERVAELAELQEKVLGTSLMGFVAYRLDTGQCVLANDATARIVGASVQDLLAQNFEQIPSWKESGLLAAAHRAISTGKEQHIEVRMKTTFGRSVWLDVNLTLFFGMGQEHLLAMIEDITQRKESEAVLIQNEEKYRNLFNSAEVAMFRSRADGSEMLDVNQKFLEIVGRERDEVIGHPGAIHWADLSERTEMLRRLWKDGCVSNYEYKIVTRHGDIGHCLTSIKLYADQGILEGSILDITERKRAEQQIQELARQLELERNDAQDKAATDALTGLPNRRAFDEVLHKEFFRLKRSGLPLSLFMIDVDHFKEFNDAYGHLRGDDCLIQVAHALRDIGRRAPDFVARYGGEEFVVILPETNAHEAALMAERARSAVASLRMLHTSSVTDYVTISVGAVTTLTVNLASPATVVDLADNALYLAKRAGRNRCELIAHPPPVERP